MCFEFQFELNKTHLWQLNSCCPKMPWNRCCVHIFQLLNRLRPNETKQKVERYSSVPSGYCYFPPLCSPTLLVRFDLWHRFSLLFCPRCIHATGRTARVVLKKCITTTTHNHKPVRDRCYQNSDAWEGKK